MRKKATATNTEGKKEKSLWTVEKKAELRKLMPQRLNKLGEWFFSEASLREYLIVNDEKAVMR